MRKKLTFLGTSLDDLHVLPESSQQKIDYQLDRIQQGLNPYDQRLLLIIGPGMQEIRICDADGIYRVIYIVKFGGTVYILHCFQKRIRTISQSDTDLGKRHYGELVQERKDEG